ncbi:hypothetical protein [Bacillus sp. FJAT-26390]|uniref:hypothetical protein n=1 Tax=Bacillus sp. FJAT-26390 TaxID=1743142 RepID=UPI0008080385|nr:hypothetical protein [Bacillus sp. FJAT-26390]OBZ17646.1 hypothetical protein A7975_07285 [Bacillus sp. FJAT-26390]
MDAYDSADIHLEDPDRASQLLGGVLLVVELLISFFNSVEIGSLVPAHPLALMSGVSRVSKDYCSMTMLKKAKASPAVYKDLKTAIYCKYIYVFDVQAWITGGFIACPRPL